MLLFLLACAGDDPAPDRVPPVETERTGSTADTSVDGATDETGVAGTGTTGDTAAPPVVTVDLDPPVQLTFPGVGTTHHHATAAWGADDDFVLAWTVGTVPNTLALARRFLANGTGAGDPVQLNDSFPTGDKPDIVFDGSRYTVTWDAEQPAAWLRRLDAAGQPLGPSVVVVEPEGVVNAPDVAVAADGSGVLVYNLADLPVLGEGGGMHLMQAFGTALELTGPRAVMSISAMTTPDITRTPAGDYAALWTEAYDHPTVPGERYYEVHGRLYFADGTARSFRADDLDAAWPSRPAIAAAGGRMAVSWRDKTSSRGEPAGAYGRLYDADGDALGPSLLLGPPGHDGDRCVVVLSEQLAVFVWQHTDPGTGSPEAWMRVLDPASGEPLTDAFAVTEVGNRADERPSVSARFAADGADLLLTWESRAPGEDTYSVWGRRVHLTLD